MEICRLCLEKNSESLEIFDQNGYQLKIALLIGKHFWFEPNEDDAISSSICNGCWTKLSDFHDFYEDVEKAHQILNADILIKTEENMKFNSSRIEEVLLPSKQEPDDLQIDELYEESVDVLNDELEENNTNFMKFEDSSEAKHQPLETDKDEECIDDDVDKFEEDNCKEVESDSEIKINDDEDSCSQKESTKTRKRNRKQKNTTKTKNQVKQSQQEAAENVSTYKGRGRPCDGEVAPSKAKVKSCTEETDSESAAQGHSNAMNCTISEYMQLHCDICSLELNTFGLIRSHMMAVHKVKPYVKCCDKKFFKRALLYDHIKIHLNPNTYKCEECDAILSDKRSLKRHQILKHLSDESKTFQCPQCPKKFAKNYLLQDHITRHSDELKYFCQQCGKGFSYMSGLTSHTTLQHTNYGTMCDICSKVIKGPAAFRRHQLEHTGIAEPKVQCDLCGSWHKNKLNLAKHKRRHKYREQPQVCNICQKTYASREQLYRHKRCVHEADSKYECNICNKSFKWASSLKDHKAQQHLTVSISSLQSNSLELL